jgi:histidyl-tRNA synthetase
MVEKDNDQVKRVKYQKPRGTYDLFGRDFAFFDKVLEVCQKTAVSYGFERIETPILEDADLFAKGVGVGTDIVNKEMYVVKGRRGKNLALRPEGTASVVRAYIENGMTNRPKPVKLWYFGPFFRHERPQAGRYRQFWQFGFESLGRKNPVVDVQIIQIFFNVFSALKLKNLIVQINSIGCSRCRARYIKNLRSFLKSFKSAICTDCQKRLESNPLRVLDCKKDNCQEIINGAPQILDSLCKKCRFHFKEVLELLDGLQIPYKLNPFLVRGLDYYTRTVFEFFYDPKKDSEEPLLALGGGGRYDELVKLLGGRATPACGAAAGVERTVDLMKEKRVKLKLSSQPQFFLAQLGPSAKIRALVLFEQLRKANIPVVENFSRDSLKIQLANAHRLGIRYVLILGQKEVIENEIILKDMEKKTQKNIKLDKVVQELRKRLR